MSRPRAQAWSVSRRGCGTLPSGAAVPSTGCLPGMAWVTPTALSPAPSALGRTPWGTPAIRHRKLQLSTGSPLPSEALPEPTVWCLDRVPEREGNSRGHKAEGLGPLRPGFTAPQPSPFGETINQAVKPAQAAVGRLPVGRGRCGFLAEPCALGATPPREGRARVVHSRGCRHACRWRVGALGRREVRSGWRYIRGQDTCLPLGKVGRGGGAWASEGPGLWPFSWAA